MDAFEIEIERKVKTIYPKAICYWNNAHEEYWEFCIMDGPIETIKYGRWENQYSEWFPTEGMAWIDSWNEIQQQMLKKLEE